MKLSKNLDSDESVQSQTFAENSKEYKQTSSELIHREYLEGSAIVIVNTQDKWFAAIGTKRLTEYYQGENAKQKLLEYIETWPFTIILISAIAQDMYENLTQPKQ